MSGADEPLRGPRQVLEFWFDFASTYSYLSAMRIEAMAADAGLATRWRPFLLGPLFKAHGWHTSPFNVYPAKGRYMVRDISRIADARGLDFEMPAVFPANSLNAARVALAGNHDWTARFGRAVFHAEFAQSRDIADRDVLRSLIALCGRDADAVLADSQRAETKARLRTETETAASLGIFGAPTFRTPDGELFWGDDRLEQAIAWGTARAIGPP